MFLGIDTSNYTTSVAVCDSNGNVIANLKAPLPVKEGERGLRQSDAVFHHTVQLPRLLSEARDSVSGEKIVAVGVSARPTDREGSYMPCFLAGVSAASALQLGAGCELFTFSHQCGHIMSALYSSESLHLIGKPFAAFHVSGGTTDILLCTPGKDGRPFEVDRIGGTLDINAGQAIDRAGVYMGLRFPAGAALEKLARRCNVRPSKEKICVNGLSCNLSGLENKACALYDKGAPAEEVAAFVIDFVKRTLLKLTENLLCEYKDIPIVYAGGVMSCGIIKEELSAYGSFALPAFSADNAAGTALLTGKTYLKEI
ncbi:MAG: peptidase M22 [Clostridia bacterium]|nr:peptidase M22 [Clostridia bacterium]